VVALADLTALQVAIVVCTITANWSLSSEANDVAGVVKPVVVAEFSATIQIHVGGPGGIWSTVVKLLVSSSRCICGALQRQAIVATVFDVVDDANPGDHRPGVSAVTRRGRVGRGAAEQD